MSETLLQLKIKHDKGQYFTKNNQLKNKVYEFIKNNPQKILEPSVGRGDLVSHIIKLNQNIIFDMFEIDKNIKLLDDINLDIHIINYVDFLNNNFINKYKTIIGNPPYIKNTTGNLYIKFIEKCYKYYLEDKGELIFIIPSDFFKLTSSSKLINEMLKLGNFTDIYYPNNENLFENASIDIIIFRYCKDKNLINKNKINYNNETKYLYCKEGIIKFTNKNIIDDKNTKYIKDYFNVHVGLVSGKEGFFKNKEFGNIKILNKEKVLDDYILIDKLPSNKKMLDYFNKNKKILIERKIKKFNEKNWFEWGALRNYETIQKYIKENKNKKCVYISTLSRHKNIAFIDKVQLFGGGLIMLYPKTDLGDNILNKIKNNLNSDIFKKDYLYSGRFKIGHKQISNAIIN
jgi:adenine-specific DNA-methyltransferase